VNKILSSTRWVNIESGQCRLGAEMNFSVLLPRSSVSPSLTTNDLKGIFTISSRYLMALPLPTTMADGARLRRSFRLPEWSGSV